MIRDSVPQNTLTASRMTSEKTQCQQQFRHMTHVMDLSEKEPFSEHAEKGRNHGGCNQGQPKIPRHHAVRRNKNTPQA